MDDSVPGGTAPAGLDFSTPALQSRLAISPALNHVFFIRDGFTGKGAGSVQPSPLQYFGLRVADACETQSLDGHPAPGLRDATQPCP